MSRHHWAAEITSSHLQSLIHVFLDAFDSVFAEAHDCVVRIPDAIPGIPSDIYRQVVAHAMLPEFQDASCDKICSSSTLSFSRTFALLSGTLSQNNISVSLLEDFWELQHHI